MQCPKCHSNIDENTAVCPKCHKVFLLECPNCHSLGETQVCEKCGYTILIKCSKCSKLNSVTRECCSNCGFDVKTSIAYQECESDEFASVVVSFGSLKHIRRYLKSQEMYSKFFFKLKNLLLSQVKSVDCKLVVYNDIFSINFCKELSFATSSNKAVRFALKLLNAFVELNANVLKELGVSLNMSVLIEKKRAEDLLQLSVLENSVKSLTIKKNSKKYLKGFQLIMDQYVCDEINKDYKTDSLYTVENNARTLTYYEIILDSYILPPSENKEDSVIKVAKPEASKSVVEETEKDLYSFKVFDINAKCSFEKVPSGKVIEAFSKIPFDKGGRIVSLRSEESLRPDLSEVVAYLKNQDQKIVRVTCTELLNYKPWGFLEAVFRDYCKLAFNNNLIDTNGISPSFIQSNKALFELLRSKSIKSMSSEDARFAYMDYFGNFLRNLKDTIILVDGFEYIDDTSIQTLELFFDNFKNIKPNFIFVTDKKVSVHSRLKGLLRTTNYTEISLQKTTLEYALSLLNSDATDFIQSFYYEKIKENFSGSYLYFKNAIEYLKEAGVLLDFENRLIIKSKKSVILPKDLNGLYKQRIKNASKEFETSLIFAYSVLLGARIDKATLEQLGIKDVEKTVQKILSTGLISQENNIIYINNYNKLQVVIQASLKKEAESFIAKNVMAHLGKGLDDTTMFGVMGRLGAYKEEYLTLWKNAQFAINTGDYDAYLKNCLGFLSLVEQVDLNISLETIEENKKDVYNNILLYLYSYSPTKIYFIENVLLMDALKEGDDDKIVKLSNLMLQGALISSNYTDALNLLYNILSRMSQPTLLVDGAINTKFLLLSLVKIEILYNIGSFEDCIEIAENVLQVLSPEIIEKVKPTSFSTNLFVSHLLETFRLAAFAKLFLMEEDLEEFFAKITRFLNVDFPEKDCILAIKDFLRGKVYSTSNIESYSSFSKIIFLILQEFALLKDDYKRFAQNIYQAKLLAADIHNREIEMFCDLLIAYVYSQIGIPEKAISIYEDVLMNSEKSAMFNMHALSKYFIAKLKLTSSSPEESLLLINDTLALIRRHNNQSKILFAIFEKLYLDIVISQEMTSVDAEAEKQTLISYKDSLKVLLGEI